MKVDGNKDEDIKDKESDETKSSEEIAEYKDSYILTMSQSMIGDESMRSNKDEESFVFEPFTQVGYS